MVNRKVNNLSGTYMLSKGNFHEKSTPGNEIKIFDLVNMIAGEMGFKGNIVWDKTKPDGQPRRCLDTSRAKELFGFEAKTSLQDGIRKPLEWYESL